MTYQQCLTQAQNNQIAAALLYQTQALDLMMEHQKGLIAVMERIAKALESQKK